MTLSSNAQNVLNGLKEIFAAFASAGQTEDDGYGDVAEADNRVIQGTVRGGNVLHLQYGVQGDYEKEDVTLNEAHANSVRKAIAAGGPNVVTSLAGSNTRYLRGKLYDDGSVEIDGIAVDTDFEQ